MIVLRLSCYITVEHYMSDLLICQPPLQKRKSATFPMEFPPGTVALLPCALPANTEIWMSAT